MTRWFEPLAMFALLWRIRATMRMEDQRSQPCGPGPRPDPDPDTGDGPGQDVGFPAATDPAASDAAAPDLPPELGRARNRDQDMGLGLAPEMGRDREVGPNQGRFPDRSERVFDYAQTVDDFWFDYVADLGDAFDPTMCVAWHLGREELSRADIDPRLHDDPEYSLPDGLPGPPADDVPAVLPRGRLLIMGGDQVYPNASTARYLNQTLGPYELAWESSPDTLEPQESGLLVLPANHDWYGGIGPFRDAFCSERKIGGWRTAQPCTWWSARLAHDWWVWGLDTGLDGTINQTQYEYFRTARDRMPAEARLIVCVPVPMWRLRERHVDRLDNLARFFFGLGVEPEIYLSGDHHIAALHRRDRIDGETEWHLTDGGGGAFQHPVHNLDRRIPNRYGGLAEPKVADDEPFQLIATWPSNTESREGTGGWWHLLFDRAAASLVASLAALQLLVMALVGANRRSEADDLRSVTDTVRDHLLPFGAIAGVLVIVVATFVLARASSSARSATLWARSVGFGHGVIQALVFTATQLLGNLLARRVIDVSGSDYRTAAGTWLVLAATATVGAALSIIVLGSYLRFANRQFRMHDNESYSARHSGDNRHFARFRIAADGTLSCYVIAFRKTGEGWAEAMAGPSPHAPASASKPELIDVRFRTRASDRPGHGGGRAQVTIS